jgi:hypothetical protein
MPSKLLAVHLNDHLAAATATLELARRVAGQYEGTPLGSFARELEPRLDEDRRTIEGLMTRFGASRDPVKQGAAWVAEKAGRLKLNGHIVKRSPLSPLVEIEGLTLGLAATALLWRNLASASVELGLDRAQFDAALDRAETDQRSLDRLRDETARRALTSAG